METTPFLLSPPVYLCPFFASDLIIYEIVPDGKKAHNGIAFFANWRQLNYILASHHVRAVGRIASLLTPWSEILLGKFFVFLNFGFTPDS